MRASTLVAAGAHLVVGERFHHHLRAVELREVAVGRGLERDRDEALVHVDEPVLEVPGVAPAGRRGLRCSRTSRRACARTCPSACARRAGPSRGTSRGNQVCHTCAGSTTWSSTLMIFGSSIERSLGRFRRIVYLTLASGNPAADLLRAFARHASSEHRRLTRSGSRPSSVPQGRAALPIPRAGDRGAGDRRGALHDPGRRTCNRRASTCASARSRTGSAAASCPATSRSSGGSRTTSSTSSTCARTASVLETKRPVPDPVEGAAVVAARRCGARRTRRARPAASTCSPA